MNWDRRAFVKFAVGAVVGLHAGPLVPKLMDDVAIWTQNWSWVPDPEAGEMAFANSFNPTTGTAVRLRMIKGRTSGERLIRVEGNPEHPLAGGGVIPADASALQGLYYDAPRVTQPWVRDAVSGVQTPVSWEKAVEFLAKKLSEMKGAGQAKALAILADDDGGTLAEMLLRFANAYGTPNLVFNPSADTTLAVAGQKLFGEGEIGFDLMGADYVISFGTPLLEGWGAPVAARKAFTTWRDAGKGFVQVESRASITASSADQWVACKPGTEAMVALGLGHLMVKGGASLPGASAAYAPFTPEKVAEATGVKPEQLAKLAAAFIKAPHGLAVCGPGNSGDPGSTLEFMAVLALNALKGNLGKPGGVVKRQPVPAAPLGEPVAAALDRPLSPAGEPYSLAQAAMAGKPYQLGCLMVVGCNPAYTGPQAKVMTQFLESVPFLVAISPYKDETTAMADLVLPAATFLEGWGDCGPAFGAAQASYGVHKPLVSPHPAAKSAGDWILALAAKLGGPVAEALPFASMEEAMAKRLEGLGGLEELSEKGWWLAEKPAYGELGFSGALDFSGLMKGEHGEGHYPLVMAGIPSLRTGSGEVPMTPYMTKILDTSTLAHTDKLVVELNPATAEELHIGEGDSITISSHQGSITALAHLFPGAAPGAVYVPVGLGREALDEYLKGRGANFYSLVEVKADPISGQPLWGLTPVQVSKGRGMSHG